MQSPPQQQSPRCSPLAQGSSYISPPWAGIAHAGPQEEVLPDDAHALDQSGGGACREMEAMQHAAVHKHLWSKTQSNPVTKPHVWEPVTPSHTPSHSTGASPCITSCRENKSPVLSAKSTTGSPRSRWGGEVGWSRGWFAQLQATEHPGVDQCGAAQFPYNLNELRPCRRAAVLACPQTHFRYRFWLRYGYTSAWPQNGCCSIGVIGVALE